VPLIMRLELPLLGRVTYGRDGRKGNAGEEDFARVIQDVGRALRYGSALVRPGCLTRGVTLFYFLRRAGMNVRLCFGARYRGGSFEAHCWLERCGAAYLEKAEEVDCPFRCFYSIPQDNRA
jgi:hypothetical protein